ncbi:MAG: hypothetical protein A2W99_00665 [Bacteroidetes bacterium GWF2_33_16]|nr:MAG: hypothetical protein A2X00_03370 [Bacteroidetes bacterium GWE2_32_14]OFY08779.1 MAG: hypothetical protein A2W99_00665 [Bacteroidetes bacterium GWF2_33_16]
MKNKLILLTAMILIASAVIAQKKYSLDEANSKLTIEGTSSVHDWSMNSTIFSGTVLFETEENIPTSILDIKFSSKADKILSDNSIMDSKTHKALKAETHPDITFIFKSVKSYKKLKDAFSGEITGILSIAGKSKNITLSFSGKVHPSGAVNVKGVVPLKMTDFGVNPPTAMLGALKTGDDIKINYDFQFINQ